MAVCLHGWSLSRSLDAPHAVVLGHGRFCERLSLLELGWTFSIIVVYPTAAASTASEFVALAAGRACNTAAHLTAKPLVSPMSLQVVCLVFLASGYCIRLLASFHIFGPFGAELGSFHYGLSLLSRDSSCVWQSRGIMIVVAFLSMSYCIMACPSSMLD